MSRISTALPIPKGMYRHFSVITLLATACMAIFADGERRQSISDEVNAQNQKAELRKAEAEKNGVQSVAVKEQRYGPRGGWGSDGIVSADPGADAQSQVFSIGDGNGGIRAAERGDLGVFGPLSKADIKAGRIPLPKASLSQRRRQDTSPTPAQRAALDRVMSSQAGAPTPVS